MSEFPWNKILSAYQSDIVVAEAEIRRHKMEADKYEKKKDWLHVIVYREYEAVARWRKEAAEYTYEHLRKQKYEAQKRANMKDAMNEFLGDGIADHPLVGKIITKV